MCDCRWNHFDGEVGAIGAGRDHVRIHEDAISLAIEDLDAAREFIREPRIVRIEEAKVLAARFFHGEVARDSLLLMRLLQHRDAVAKALEDRERTIGRSVIRHDHFAVAKALRQPALDRTRNRARAIVDRRYYR